MSSISSTIETARSALRAQQIALNVTGDNIANVNTPGYSRKTPNLKTGFTVAGYGTGVKVESLTRARDLLLDGQFRFEGHSLGNLEVLERAMRSIEAIFTELAGGGASEPGTVFNQASSSALSGGFSRFFNSFQDLANNPESQTARAVVREEASFLVDQFHRIQDQLSVLRFDMEAEVKQTLLETNRIIRQLAKLNTKILSTDVAGSLEDERDRLLDDLSKLLKINIREQVDGTVAVSAAPGILLVDAAGVFVNELTTRPVSRNNAVVSDVALVIDGKAIDPVSGKLGGLLQARDEKIVSAQENLDIVAETLVSRVNLIHSAGFGLDGSSGTNFFIATQDSAREIAISQEVLGGLDKIAASSTAVGNGDGVNALALSGLASEKVLGGGTRTIEEFYADLIGQIGADAKEVFTNAETQRLVVEQVEIRRENVRGVSLNEEATNLILFQRAFQAAARIVTIVDEMMQSLLNI